MTQVLESDVAALRKSCTGVVVTRDDDGYHAGRSIWNGAIDRRPAVIARCSSGVDVAATIEFARTRGLEISVRGGGHSGAGYSVSDGGLMIHLGDMKQVRVDSAARRAVCGGGVTWGDVDAATQAHGLAVPGGIVRHTGIGGLTLGGGLGWLNAKAGLTADNLVAAELVTASGRIVRASAEKNPNLFWAIRGGDGNFGVVTSFEYRLHEVGPLVHIGYFFWGSDRAAEALRFCRDFVKGLPDDMGVGISGVNASPRPYVPEQHHYAPGVALIVVGFGSAEEHQRAVRPVRQEAAPLFELVSPLPYTNLQKLVDEGFPWGILNYDKALYIDEFTDDVIHVFAEHLAKKTSLMSMVAIQRLNGAYERVGEDETAFGGSRAAT
jgi:FAD/FMN-containing dehydrogenase